MKKSITLALAAITIALMSFDISTGQNVRSTDPIEVSNLKAGIYSLKIETAGKVAVKPFVKQ